LRRKEEKTKLFAYQGIPLIKFLSEVIAFKSKLRKLAKAKELDVEELEDFIFSFRCLLVFKLNLNRNKVMMIGQEEFEKGLKILKIDEKLTLGNFEELLILANSKQCNIKIDPSYIEELKRKTKKLIKKLRFSKIRLYLKNLFKKED